jgi:hypothetical protein
MGLTDEWSLRNHLKSETDSSNERLHRDPLQRNCQ